MSLLNPWITAKGGKAAISLKICYFQKVNEKAFITKIHRALDPFIYKWKINDPYHGGVPDVYYAGPEAWCFVEYKYRPVLPARETSKLKFNLSPQQKNWLETQHNFKIPVFVIAGCEDKAIMTVDFDSINHYTKRTFLNSAIPITTLIVNLEQYCLKGISIST